MTVAKISPRQKMINVMYLILTAMLALNVSAEILRAFFLMEQSMDKSGVNIDLKNDELMLAFDRQMQTQPDITRLYHSKAREAKRISADFIQYVENLKNVLSAETGGREEGEAGKKTELKGRDNIEKHADMLINKKKGEELRLKINETRQKLLALLPAEDSGKVVSDLFAEGYGEQSWESFHFEHSPLAAVVAMMSKIQNDCKNTTYDVLYTLFKHIGGSTIPIDKVEAAIVPKSSYLMKGDQFEADIFLTAFSSRQANEIYINGQKVTEENGKFTYKIPANTTGNHTLKGEIWVRESDSLRKYPFETSYNVFKGGASISADNTRILYKGIDNPLTITVPGVAPDRVRATISSGNLVQTGESEYNALPAATGTITVRVSTRDDYGNWSTMGEETFTVRSLPPVTVTLGALDPAQKYTTGMVEAQNMLVAGMGGVFINGLNYKVQSFDMMIIDPRRNMGPPIHNVGHVLNNQCKEAIKNMKPGSSVYFSNVLVDKKPGLTYSVVINSR